jgi:hypothetical protein
MTHHARSATRRRTFARTGEFLLKLATSRMSFPGIDTIERVFHAPYHDDSPMMQASAKQEAEYSEDENENAAYFLVTYPDREFTFTHPHDVLTEYMNYVVNIKGNPEWFMAYYVPANSESGFPVSIEWDGPVSGTMPRFTDDALRKICANR